MKKSLLWIALAAISPLVVVGSLVIATAQGQVSSAKKQAGNEPYVCPVTGELLPCPECCPYKNQK